LEGISQMHQLAASGNVSARLAQDRWVIDAYRHLSEQWPLIKLAVGASPTRH